MFHLGDLDPRNGLFWRAFLKRRRDDPPTGWIEVIIQFVVLGLLILSVAYLIHHIHAGLA